MNKGELSKFETLWRAGDKTYPVSKFLAADITISVVELDNRWRTWTVEEKRRFASAYSAKPQLHEEDYRVLEFLMEKGDPGIWSSIVLMLTKHPDRERMLKFVLTRIEAGDIPLANYYQALARFNHPAAVPLLERMYSFHHEQIDSVKILNSFEDIFPYVDYIACCAALVKIRGGDEYITSITKLLNHPDERVRHQARLIPTVLGLELG